MNILSKTEYANIIANPGEHNFQYFGTLFIDPNILERFSETLIISEFDKSLTKRFAGYNKPFKSYYYFDKISELGFQVHFFFQNCNLEKYLQYGIRTKTFDKYCLSIWNKGLSLVSKWIDYQLYKRKVS